MATVRKIEVRFPAEEVERMMALVNQARLPSQLPFNGAEGWGFGMDLSWLKKVHGLPLHEIFPQRPFVLTSFCVGKRTVGPRVVA